MKTFLQHLMESDREFTYRLKFACELADNCVEQIKELLVKYELREFVGPKKTIIQESPLDFPDLRNVEVSIIDVVTGAPISPYILQQELRTNLKLNEKFIVVKSDNDPLEIETKRVLANKDIDTEATKRGLEKTSLLDVSEVYPEAELSIPGEELYGNDYNAAFLNTLATVAATRKESTEKPKSPLFDYLEIKTPEEDNDFNKDIVDAPKVVPWWKAKTVKTVETAPTGNFDDEGQTVYKLYKKGDQTVVLKRNTDNLRKTK
jgi:hypothetical protein